MQSDNEILNEICETYNNKDRIPFSQFFEFLYSNCKAQRPRDGNALRNALCVAKFELHFNPQKALQKILQIVSAIASGKELRHLLVRPAYTTQDFPFYHQHCVWFDWVDVYSNNVKMAENTEMREVE